MQEVIIEVCVTMKSNKSLLCMHASAKTWGVTSDGSVACILTIAQKPVLVISGLLALAG